MKYICSNAKQCEHVCLHKKPHTHSDLKGCGNVRCIKLGLTLEGADMKAVGQGLIPASPVDCTCVEEEKPIALKSK